MSKHAFRLIRYNDSFFRTQLAQCGLMITAGTVDSQ